jgi:hypothetical protein
MKQVMLLALLGSVIVGVAACAKTCEVEPIVEQNHQLVVPPNFGNKPVK